MWKSWTYTCRAAQEEDTDITLIDINPDRINEITDEVDAMGVVGNGASINTLMEAGIENADILISQLLYQMR